MTIYHEMNRTVWQGSSMCQVWTTCMSLSDTSVLAEESDWRESHIRHKCSQLTPPRFLSWLPSKILTSYPATNTRLNSDCRLVRCVSTWLNWNSDPIYWHHMAVIKRVSIAKYKLWSNLPNMDDRYVLDEVNVLCRCGITVELLTRDRTISRG